MKKWMTILAFGGLISTTGSSADSISLDAQVATAPAASDDALPCLGCCPPHICGFNGPSLDGTTVPTERSAK